MEMTIVARPGYAIGGIHTRTDLTVDAFRLSFMRFHNGRKINMLGLLAAEK